MSSTEMPSVDHLALALFDDVVTPLSATAAGRQRARRFAGSFDSSADSYFDRPHVAAVTGAASPYPGGGSIDGFVDALASYWTDLGETDLATMKPHLQKIALALEEENEDAGGEVDIFCYTMF